MVVMLVTSGTQGSRYAQLSGTGAIPAVVPFVNCNTCQGCGEASPMFGKRGCRCVCGIRGWMSQAPPPYGWCCVHACMYHTDGAACMHARTIRMVLRACMYLRMVLRACMYACMYHRRANLAYSRRDERVTDGVLMMCCTELKADEAMLRRKLMERRLWPASTTHV